MTSAIWGLAVAILATGVWNIMSNARLIASVHALTAVTASAITLIEGLAERIREAAGDEDASNALADELDNDSAELAAAVTANTVAQGESQAVAEPTATTDTTAPPSDSGGSGGVGQGPDTTQPDESNQNEASPPVDQGAAGGERTPDSLDQNAAAQEAAGQNPEGGFGQSDQQPSDAGDAGSGSSESQPS